jgi:hypothetical protein
VLTFSFRSASLTGRDTAREGAEGVVVSAMAAQLFYDVTRFTSCGNQVRCCISSNWFVLKLLGSALPSGE